ncbi:MAG: trigger factor [Solirubrobacterales bacterium]|nr:trigger factor [Solirubrobacterales bacterium]
MELTTEVTDLPDSKVKIAATVSSGEVDRKLEHAARDYAREMKFPGFRKGKVPPQLVLQRLGRDAVMEQALREGLPEWYERALLDSKVSPVGDPKLDMPDPPAEGEPLEFTIEVSVRPEAKLGEYKGLEVGKPEPEVPEEAIDAEVERMRESMAGLNPVERAATSGDYLLIDYAGEIEGEPFDGGTSTDYLLELGSNEFIAGFNEALEGAESGQERLVELNFPDEYHAEHLAGKPATFKVQVKEVREKTLPELDDDFAADNSDFDTLAELRADIEHRLEHAAEHRAEHAFRDAALTTAVEAAEIEVSEEIVTARATEVWEGVERSLASRGMDPEAYLKIQGKTREEAIAESHEEAEAGLRRESVLVAIADAEEIAVTDEEMLEALQPPAGQKGNPEKLLKRLRTEGREELLAEEIRLRKAADLVVESAKPVPIPVGQAETREEIWTPEGEGQAKGGDLWTPGGD